MAGWRQAIELALSDEDIAALAAISRSRTEPASQVERVRMLLSYRVQLADGPNPPPALAGGHIGRVPSDIRS